MGGGYVIFTPKLEGHKSERSKKPGYGQVMFMNPIPSVFFFILNIHILIIFSSFNIVRILVVCVDLETIGQWSALILETFTAVLQVVRG